MHETDCVNGSCIGGFSGETSSLFDELDGNWHWLSYPVTISMQKLQPYDAYSHSLYDFIHTIEYKQKYENPCFPARRIAWCLPYDGIKWWQLQALGTQLCIALLLACWKRRGEACWCAQTRLPAKCSILQTGASSTCRIWLSTGL